MSESGASYSTVSCAVVEELLPGYADGTLSIPARDLVHRHVETCDGCREQLREMERGQGLGAVVLPAPDGEWVEPLAGQTGGGREGRRRSNAVRMGLALGGLAGVGLLGGVVAGRFSAERRREVAPKIAVAVQPKVRVVVPRVAPVVSHARGEGEFADLLNVGDDELRQAGFSLQGSIPLRVHAVGEGSDGQMYDYAWITNARTHEPVWIMEYGETNPAGGASKNREVDRTLKLDAGDYILYYSTDGSHSADGWNSSPPRNPDLWGVTLSVVNKSDLRKVREFDPANNKSALVSLVGAGDDAHLASEFALDKEAEVRVYAIGEGIGGEMYDYGWIEDARSHSVVWQMEYAETQSAGGAEKNRMVNRTVRLPAGRYVVHYVSDDSHSFDDWNDSPPRDPANYGITVSRADR
jgi:Putative zinc-finger